MEIKVKMLLLMEDLRDLWSVECYIPPSKKGEVLLLAQGRTIEELLDQIVTECHRVNNKMLWYRKNDEEV